MQPKSRQRKSTLARSLLAATASFGRPSCSTRQVVSEPAPAVANPLLEDDSEQVELGVDSLIRGGDDEPQSSGKRRPWARMLRHVWKVDVSICPRCSGPMKWVDVATEAEAIRPCSLSSSTPATTPISESLASVDARHPLRSFGLGSGRSPGKDPLGGWGFVGQRPVQGSVPDFPCAGPPALQCRPASSTWVGARLELSCSLSAHPEHPPLPTRIRR